MLAVAGDRASTSLLEPADNSGYSIGTIQTDLGQHYPEKVSGTVSRSGSMARACCGHLMWAIPSITAS
jgi:hypothetical protein